MRAFRVHGHVHGGIVPWLVISAVVSAFGARALIHEWSSGWLNVPFGFGFIFIVGSATIALHLGWKVLVAYGLVPLVVVWRRRSEVWVGTAMAPLGLSRRRIRMQGRDVRVQLLDASRPQQASAQLFYVRVTSGGANLDLRSYGAVDPRELQEFLVLCGGVFGGFPTPEDREP